MPRKRTVSYPSDSICYPKIVLQLPTTRSPERLHLWNEVRETAVGRSETRTAFILRAIAREVVRCKRIEDSKPLSERLAQQDRDELAVLALLSDEEMKEWGL